MFGPMLLDMKNWQLCVSRKGRRCVNGTDTSSYDGYQVVRRELFAHLREPAVVIRRDSVTFNTACIAGLEDAVYIQILVNQDNKRMVVRKCEENDKDAFVCLNIIQRTGILKYVAFKCWEWSGKYADGMKMTHIGQQEYIIQNIIWWNLT